ncbi:glycoside hydrolase family 3 protein [Actinomyces minihominis]|uniref:glycoside hydrolase family 3 protein n=1 Tax=Actinomyces minihominis TaxID=2002838 RepID=UPI000C08A97B|nr:glycoside hydrolase family 3 protein [Actinomyces minihominis]
MATRKEIKTAAVAEAETLKAARAVRSAELAAMDPTARKAAKAADRASARAARAAEKAQRKAARAGMSRSARRADKRQTRITRKVINRPRRAIGWGVVAAIGVLAVVIATPYVTDISRLFRINADSQTPAGVDARVYGQAVSRQIADEGLVLLKNEEQILPLEEGAVNVFGMASFKLRYGGGGSGGADQSQAISLYEALEMEGIDYNPDLYQTMIDNGAKSATSNSTGLVDVVKGMLTKGGGDEIDPSYLTAEVMANASQFAETALVVIGIDSIEVQDLSTEHLRLNDVQRALLDTVTAEFEDVVVIVNSGNQMELGFLDEYPQIKGAIWMGTPGPYGAVSLARALTGEVNPSGRLPSTYAYDVESAPSTVNLGNYQYDNAKRGFINYEEGIYVGYRFYETFYEGDDDAYWGAVQFPFGFGLSYTDFEWKTSEPVISDDSVAVVVQVTNRGERAGKDVVEVYYSAPYIAGGIEKSAVELGGYAKTSMLEPGASETLKIVFPKREMASWDTEGGGRYVLDAGNYQLHVSTDIHRPVESFDFTVDDTIFYSTDEVTDTELGNLFDYVEGDLTYLSRADWEGTYPDEAKRNFTASDELLAAMPTLSEQLASGNVEATEGEVPTYGAQNGIVLEDLKGLPYNDPMWDLYLDQFTSTELVNLHSRGAWGTAEISRLGIPSTVMLDGPAGLNSFFTKITAASYPTAVVVAATWNDALAYALGEAIGLEAVAYGVQGWYAPGMNIHRTAMGGRNFEYYSEDPLLSGKIGAAMVAGAEAQGITTTMKHFVLNDQEINARSGVNVFTSEQALREIYLKPFEITVKEGGASGAMSSFIHLGPKWAGGNPELLQDLLREEWGFEGFVTTDAVLGAFMDPAQAAVSGNELMLTPIPTATARATFKALDADPVGMGHALRDRAHQTAYTILQSNLFD